MNPADAMTKYLAEAKLNNHLEALNAKFEDGRAMVAPALDTLGLMKDLEEIMVSSEGLQAESCCDSLGAAIPPSGKGSIPIADEGARKLQSSEKRGSGHKTGSRDEAGAYRARMVVDCGVRDAQYSAVSGQGLRSCLRRYIGVDKQQGGTSGDGSKTKNTVGRCRI